MGMCTQMESEQTPKPTNTHKMIHMELLRKQVDKFIWTQITLDFCQSVKRPHPSQALSAQCSFLPSPEERQCCERLSWKRGCSCFLCKNTCLNSSKAKGKSRLSASVTALDKNSAETVPKTSTQAKQCTCAGMTPAGLPHSPLSFCVVCRGSTTDSDIIQHLEDNMQDIPGKIGFVLMSLWFQMHLIPLNTSGFNDSAKKKAKPKTRTLLWGCDRRQKAGLFK